MSHDPALQQLQTWHNFSRKKTCVNWEIRDERKFSYLNKKQGKKLEYRRNEVMRMT